MEEGRTLTMICCSSRGSLDSPLLYNKLGRSPRLPQLDLTLGMHQASGGTIVQRSRMYFPTVHMLEG